MITRIEKASLLAGRQILTTVDLAKMQRNGLKTIIQLTFRTFDKDENLTV